jgi:hypothetical protein
MPFKARIRKEEKLNILADDTRFNTEVIYFLSLDTENETLRAVWAPSKLNIDGAWIIFLLFEGIFIILFLFKKKTQC